MSKIDDLINRLCPDGVQHYEMSDIAEYSQTRIDTKELDEASFVGVDNLLPNKGGRTDANYSPNTSRLTAFSSGDLLIGNIRPYLKKIWLADRNGGCSGDVLAIHFREQYQAQLYPRFLYYPLSSDNFFAYDMQHAKGAKMPRGDRDAIMKFRVPVPPLPVQEEIVRILDSFTSLEAELEAELEARKKQYEYYRHLLLSRASTHSQEMHLAEIGHIVTGRTPKSSDSDAWGPGLDFITPSDISNGMKTVISPQRMLSTHGVTLLGNARVPKQSILVTCIGADMGKTVINAHECVTNQQINSLVLNEDIDVNYIFHVLSSMRDQLLAKGKRAGGTMPIINKREFSSIQIPIPDIQTQHDVASTLDSFDSLVSDLSSGLPAEIAARRKQYEFYRDRLLTFKELAA